MMSARSEQSSRYVRRVMRCGLMCYALGAYGCTASETQQRTPAPKPYVEAPQPSGGVQAIDGEVLGVDRVPVADQNSMTLSLRVAPQGKQVVSVDLGPGWYFDEQGIVFAPNDRILVKGSQAHAHGARKLVAIELEKDGAIYTRDPNEPEAGWIKQLEDPTAEAAPESGPSSLGDAGIPLRAPTQSQ